MGFWIVFIIIFISCVLALIRLSKADESAMSDKTKTVLYLKMALSIVVLLLDLLFAVFFLVQSRSERLKEADRKTIKEYKEKHQYPKEEEIVAESEMVREDKERSESELKENSENDIRTPEGAYKYLFDEVFAKENYNYLTDYNAKGNFYGNLYTGEGLFSEMPVSHIRVTAVYNGESSNGKCQVFVQYKELLDETGNVTQTQIMDFYAIDMQTKEIVRGDKHAWEDSGSKEYIEVTEK